MNQLEGLTPTSMKKQNRPPNENLYDIVKIKVLLGEEHYCILSRFLISRMLTLCRVRKLDAIQISKAIKKQLIEQNRMETTQRELEHTIFETMRKFGYENSIPKYQMVNKFYAKRTPLIIFIFGAPCIGKSMIANNLAERLNVSNVLQTNIVEIVMREISEKYSKTLIGLDTIQNNQELIEIFKHNCRVIRKGVSVDIQKCLSEGKPVIIEGIGLMPQLYVAEQNPQLQEQDDAETLKFINSYINNTIKLRKYQRRDQNLFNPKDQVKKKWKIIYPSPMESEDQTEIKRELRSLSDLQKIVIFIFDLSFLQDQKDSLTIAFQLILNRQDHRYNVENNIPSSENNGEIELRLNNYQLIQQFLLSQRSLCHIVPVNLHNLEETLDTMHDIILEKIQADHSNDLK